MTMRRWIVVTVAVAAFSVCDVRPSLADTITIDFFPVDVFALADRVTLIRSELIVDLNVFTLQSPLSLAVPAGDFAVGDSGFTSQSFEFTVPRRITVGGISRDVTADGTLSITPQIDTLSISGSTTRFPIAAHRSIVVQLDQLTRSSSVFGNFPFAITATLSEVATTPEPSTLALLATGCAGLVARTRIRRRRAA